MTLEEAVAELRAYQAKHPHQEFVPPTSPLSHIATILALAEQVTELEAARNASPHGNSGRPY